MKSHHEMGSCASCGIEDCFLNIERKINKDSTKSTAFLLDEVWPEFDTYLSEKAVVGDILISSLNGKLLKLPRYTWSIPTITKRKYLTIHGLLRSAVSRKLARETGAIRQKSNLYFDDKLVKALAGKIPYQAERLVISQNFLPALQRMGLLGGRRYAVLMTRYPLKTLHEKLDAAFRNYPESPTLNDFRVDERLVFDEWHALMNAEALISCHEDISSMFPEQTKKLPWQTIVTDNSQLSHRHRIAFLGPTLGRKGAYAVRNVAKGMQEPLIVFGRNLETPDFWNSVKIEQRSFSETALQDVGIILHPAIVEHNPRRLLAAHAHGIKIFATKECGLPPSMYEDFTKFIP